MLLMVRNQAFFDKCFKDKHGRLALTAAPNLPIIIWAVAALASHLVSHGTVHGILNFIAHVAITWWALLEIFQGVNYFRRALGAVVLAFTIYAQFLR